MDVLNLPSKFCLKNDRIHNTTPVHSFLFCSFVYILSRCSLNLHLYYFVPSTTIQYKYKCSAYENNQAVFLALICMVCALIAVIPLTTSIFRQNRTARGAGSIRLEYYGDEDPATSLRLSERSLHGNGGSNGCGNGSGGAVDGSASSHPTERTHLLTLKDMYARQRKENELKQKPRGRSIIMTSPEQDPFHLVPSSTIDTNHTKQ
jgi:hypothetical protein